MWNTEYLQLWFYTVRIFVKGEDKIYAESWSIIKTPLPLSIKKVNSPLIWFRKLNRGPANTPCELAKSRLPSPSLGQKEVCHNGIQTGGFKSVWWHSQDFINWKYFLNSVYTVQH